MFFVPSPLQSALAVNPPSAPSNVTAPVAPAAPAAGAGMVLQPATSLGIFGDPATLFGTPTAPPSYDAIVLNPNGPRSQTNLFVRKLASAVTEAEMTKMFEPYGVIVSLALMRNIHSGESLGTAFVRYETHEQARAAMAALDGAELYGRNISIQWAKRQHDGTPVGEARQKIHKLFVRNVPIDVTGRQLRQVFAQYGTIVNVTLLNDTAADTNATRSSAQHNNAADGSSGNGGGAAATTPERNIAFILFQEDGAAEKAVRGQHNTCPFASCEGIPLMVKLAEDNRQRLERRQRYGDTSNQAILLPSPLAPPLGLLQPALTTATPATAATPAGAATTTPSLLPPPQPVFAANMTANNVSPGTAGGGGACAATTTSAQVSPYNNGLSLNSSFLYGTPHNGSLATATTAATTNAAATTTPPQQPQTQQQQQQQQQSVMQGMSQLFATAPMPGFVYTTAAPSSCVLAAPTPFMTAATNMAANDGSNKGVSSSSSNSHAMPTLTPGATGMFVDPNLSFSLSTGMLQTPPSASSTPASAPATSIAAPTTTSQPQQQQQQQQQQQPMPYYVAASFSPMYIPFGGVNGTSALPGMNLHQQQQQPMQYVFAQAPTALQQQQQQLPQQLPSPCTPALFPASSPPYNAYNTTATPPASSSSQQQLQQPHATAAPSGNATASRACANEPPGMLSYETDSNHDADTVMPISSNFMDDLLCSSIADT